MNVHRRQFGAAALAMAAAWTAGAQDTYPSRAITLVVAYAPTGDTDAMARLYAARLSARLKQPVVVLNRPGAAGTLGSRYVAQAAPDGHTLLFAPNTVATAPLVMKPEALTYDVLNDFAPIVQTSICPLILVANPATGFKTLADVVDAARGGRQLAFGTPGPGSPMHIAGEWLNRAAGIGIQHVPYRANVAAQIIGGHVPLGYVTLGTVAPYLQAGKVTALAVTDPARSSFLPDVPTMAESGYPQVMVGAWHGFFAPKGTPDHVVALLNRHLNEILRMQDVIETLKHFAAEPVGGPPARLKELVAADHRRLGGIIGELGIRAD
ncbi:tripartite tricarboxylate transporter substrate binding protein [Pigmentiphaga sp. H8]|uniref:Bug family tripartite tricarboxylate transporter substrate binding protein n=1 Tax=Pigmentiphaga sp. H8 TaxID=2488560 RepID=UPI000F598765|nr:tripartite tricarboxylate transporter substrate-binding protein [Pigmentiphaga sp. H8]AZG09337.1 tripartite tricarboxylate transporter substrate binding protein [Pigmentiphaga sp. H8]